MIYELFANPLHLHGDADFSNVALMEAYEEYGYKGPYNNNHYFAQIFAEKALGVSEEIGICSMRIQNFDHDDLECFTNLRHFLEEQIREQLDIVWYRHWSMGKNIVPEWFHVTEINIEVRMVEDCGYKMVLAQVNHERMVFIRADDLDKFK